MAVQNVLTRLASMNSNGMFYNGSKRFDAQRRYFGKLFKKLDFFRKKASCVAGFGIFKDILTYGKS